MVDQYLEEGDILQSPKVLRWRNRVESRGNVIQKLDVLSIVYRKISGVFAVFLDCRLLTPEGNVITRCVLIRGDSAVIVPVLVCEDDGIIYTLLVEQRRIIDGSLTEEFPAGSSLELQDIRVTACEELSAEVGLEVKQQDLVLLSKEPIKINPDVLDDLVHFFSFERTVTSHFLSSLDGRQSGSTQEGEHIRIVVRKMADAARSMTSSVIIGVRLLEQTMNRVF